MSIKSTGIDININESILDDIVSESIENLISFPAPDELPLPNMGHPLDIEEKVYVVTLHNWDDNDSLYNDMETQGGPLHVPDRSVICTDRRSGERNTNYLLTYHEAVALSKDPRVLAVELNPKDRGIEIAKHSWSSTSRFSKSSFVKKEGFDNPNPTNWGLFRTRSKTNIPGWGSTNPPSSSTGPITTGTSSLVPLTTLLSDSSGKNVDVVIVDLGDNSYWNNLTDYNFYHPHPLTPEYMQNSDGTGNTRVIRYNWFQHMPAVSGHAAMIYPYRMLNGEANIESNEHNAHTTGTTAGNTQGFARDANIYHIDASANAQMLYVKEFHKNKPINPVTGVKNPTVTNNSWGYFLSMPLYNGSFFGAYIDEIYYRGAIYRADNYETVAKKFTITGITGSGPNTITSIEVTNASSICLLRYSNPFVYSDPLNEPNSIITTITLSGLSIEGWNGDHRVLRTPAPDNQSLYISLETNGSVVLPYQPDRNGTTIYNTGGSINGFITVSFTELNSGLTKLHLGDYITIQDTVCSGVNPNICNGRVMIQASNDYSISFFSNLIPNYVSEGMAIQRPSELGYAQWSSATIRLCRIPNWWGGGAPALDAATDANFLDAAAEGVINVVAAGNSYMYIDVPGGPDYNNYFTGGGRWGSACYYHRGASPARAYDTNNTANNPICVGSFGAAYPGSLTSTSLTYMGRFGNNNGVTDPDIAAVIADDYKSEFSNYGPRVDVYAPGLAILSTKGGVSWTDNDEIIIDPRYQVTNDPNPGFGRSEMMLDAGTSMAAPHVTGVIACLLEKNPRMTPGDVRNWITSMSPSTLAYPTSGSYNSAWTSNDPGVYYSANNTIKACTKILYLPGSRVKDSDVGGFHASTYPNSSNKQRLSSGAVYPRKTTLVSYSTSMLSGLTITSDKTNAEFLETVTITVTTGNNGNQQLPAGAKVPYNISFRNLPNTSYMVDKYTYGLGGPSSQTQTRIWAQDTGVVSRQDGSDDVANMNIAFNGSTIRTAAYGQIVPGKLYRVNAQLNGTSVLLGSDGLNKAVGITRPLDSTNNQINSTSITYVMIGKTYPHTASYPFQLPFNIIFLGTTYNWVMVNDKAFIYFGTDADHTLYSVLRPNDSGQGNFDHIKLATVEPCEAIAVYGNSTGTSPDRTFRIRYEGRKVNQSFPVDRATGAWYGSYGGLNGDPTLVFEMVFHENDPTKIDLNMGTNHASYPYLPYDSNSHFIYGAYKNDIDVPYYGHITIDSNGQGILPITLTKFPWVSIMNVRIPIYGAPSVDITLNENTGPNKNWDTYLTYAKKSITYS